ncbi:MAG: DUF2268 domain-containing putative Zn-dependent protease [Bacteroidota bacterium]
MKTLLRRAVLLLVLCLSACQSYSKKSTSVNVEVVFQEEVYSFTEKQKNFIFEVIVTAEKDVRKLLPTLPDSITVAVEKVDWDLDAVGGVTGRAESNTPPVVMVQLSNAYREGNINAVYSGLRATLFHEFHHLSRGWAIQDNVFSPGIPNAMVNEGLAVVFAEIYTKTVYEANAYPEEADSWVQEILDLPLNASYADWVMGEHPDGRTYIGYRTGNFLIRKAMTTSGKTILELSALKPEEIMKIAGY